MSKVDFSAAVFRDVEFRGYDLEEVTLLDDPDLRLFRQAHCVARRAIRMLDGHEDMPSRMLLAIRKTGSEGLEMSEKPRCSTGVIIGKLAVRNWSS
jgi:hypothetical protein